MQLPSRYSVLALWLMILLGSAIVLGPKAYEDPQLRGMFIGFCLLTIAVILVPIALKLRRR